MNKIALGIDIASQSGRVAEQSKLVSAITSLNTGSDKFSDILSAQQKKVEPPKKDDLAARERNSIGNDKPRAERAEASNERSTAPDKADRSESRRSESTSTDNNNNKIASDKAVNASEEASSKSDSGHDQADVEQKKVKANADTEKPQANSDKSSADAADQSAYAVVDDNLIVDDSVIVDGMALVNDSLVEEVVPAISNGVEQPVTESVTSLEDGSIQENLMAVGAVEDDAALVPKEASVASEAEMPLANGASENVDVLGESLSSGIAPSDTVATGTVETSQGLSGVNAKVSADGVASNTENVVNVDVADRVVQEGGQKSDVENVHLNASPTMSTITSVNDGETELVNTRINSGESRTAASQLTATMASGSSAGSSSDQSTGGQSGGQAGNNAQGNALFLKGLENAAMKSAVMGDKVVSSDKFAGLLSQQLEGLDTRMTQSPMDSRLNLNQLREIPGLRTYTTSLPVPMNQAEWGEEFSSKVTWLVNQKIQSAEIHVNPQELGPIKIEINMQNDQANVVINSQHASVRDLLELNVQRLRDMMDGSGVDLGDVDVSDQSAEQQASSSDGQNDSDQGHSPHGDETVNEDASQSASVVRMGPVSLVDYYA